MPQRRPGTNPAVGAFLPPEEPASEPTQMRTSPNTQMVKNANAQMYTAASALAVEPAATERGMRVQAQLLPAVYERVTLESARRKLHARDIIIEAAVEYFMSEQVSEEARAAWISQVHTRRPKRGAK